MTYSAKLEDGKVLSICAKNYEEAVSKALCIANKYATRVISVTA